MRHDDHIEEVAGGADEAPFAFQQQADDVRYRRVMGMVAAQPWAIRPEKLAAIVDVLSYRSAGHRLSAAEIADRIGAPADAAVEAARASQQRAQGGGVAVLRLMGLIAPRASQFEQVSSPNGTSVDRFTKAFREALASPEVGSVLIEIDSPGGTVSAVPELADEIRAARGGGKPIVAIANTQAASAAYWIGSQADELVVTPSGEVGSIGVYAAHQDVSQALEQEGVKMTLVSAGKFKVEGNPFEPLTEEARAAIQADVNAFYSMFVDAVAKGRGVSRQTVAEEFGQGRMLLARDALKAGMVDRVETFDQTVSRMLRGKTSSRAATAPSLPAASFTFSDGTTVTSNTTTTGATTNTTLSSQIRLAETPGDTAPNETPEHDHGANGAPVEKSDEPAAARSVDDIKTILTGKG